jgi:hypothetical protein
MKSTTSSRRWTSSSRNRIAPAAREHKGARPSPSSGRSRDFLSPRLIVASLDRSFFDKLRMTAAFSSPRKPFENPKSKKQKTQRSNSATAHPVGATPPSCIPAITLRVGATPPSYIPAITPARRGNSTVLHSPTTARVGATPPSCIPAITLRVGATPLSCVPAITLRVGATLPSCIPQPPRA